MKLGGHTIIEISASTVDEANAFFRDLELTGRIADIPGGTGDGLRFLFRIEQARSGGKDIGFDGLG